MATKLGPEYLAAWRNCLTAYARVLAQMEEELTQEARLPLAWYEVLLLVQESPTGQLRMHQLAESRLLSRSAATRLVDRMEEAGLVCRTAAEQDRRGTFVCLTDEGLAALRSAAPIHLRGINEHFSRHLTAKEAAVVGEAMARVARALAPETNGG